MKTELAEEAVHKVERYLFRLGVAMGNLPASQRDENVREIRAHLLDRIEAETGPLDQAADSVLQRLGTPEQLADSFERELSLARASRSSSPVLWLRTTARWALSGIEGFVCFWVAVFGYSFGTAFLLSGLLKPLFPNFIGLYVSDHALNLNRQHALGDHELLGMYFIPVVMSLGSVLYVGTTLLLKWLVSRFRLAKEYFRRTPATTQSQQVTC